MGTGQAIVWVDSHDSDGNPTIYHPLWNQTASSLPPILPKEIFTNAVSIEPTDHIHSISVTIPNEILAKNITLSGKKRPIKSHTLPFYAIFPGKIWLDENISRQDIQTVYQHFFQHQVIPAIQTGKVPKPQAMVFSGGQERNFYISTFLKELLNANGIQSIRGFDDAAHCGVARLAYPNDHVYCNFK